MKDCPLLTICLLTYNSERFIEKTLYSLLNQNYPNFEILISDNGSTDKTPEIIRSFQINNKKVIFRKNTPQREGIINDHCYDNCNGCLNSGLIRGEFVSFCHDDDIYDRDIFSKEVLFLMENPEAGAVFTGKSIINENGEITETPQIPSILKIKKKSLHNFEEIFKALLFYGNTFLPTPTFMTRKKILEEIGLFNEKDFRTSADLEMWMRIAEKNPIGILEEKLINRRVGGGGTKYQHLYTERPDFFKVMDHYLESKDLLRTTEKEFLKQYECQKKIDDILRAMNFLIKGDYKKTKTLINQGFTLDLLGSFLKNINRRRIKIMVLWALLFLAVNMGLGKHLSKLLYRLRH